MFVLQALATVKLTHFKALQSHFSKWLISHLQFIIAPNIIFSDSLC